MRFKNDLIPVIQELHQRSTDYALATLISIKGSAPRPLGAQLLVTADRQVFGQISSGCCEEAIVSEAMSCLRDRTPRKLIYGKESDIWDIVLPCGSTLEILITPSYSPREIGTILRFYQNRIPFRIDLFLDTKRPVQIAGLSLPVPEKALFSQRINPPVRLVTLATPVMTQQLLPLCDMLEIEAVPFQLNDLTSAELEQGIRQLRFRDPSDLLPYLDEFTAVVLAVHNLDLEVDLIPMILEHPIFYLGVLGSQKTALQRLELLKAQSYPSTQLDRLTSPMGIGKTAKNPVEIAMATVLEIQQKRAAL